MTTAAEIFKEMPSRFKADQASDLKMEVQFELSGDDGGAWYVKVADGACTIEEGAIDSPQATVKMDATDWVDMSTGKLNPMAAFMSGKVKVEGDLNAVMKIQQLFL